MLSYFSNFYILLQHIYGIEFKKTFFFAFFHLKLG